MQISALQPIFDASVTSISDPMPILDLSIPSVNNRSCHRMHFLASQDTCQKGDKISPTCIPLLNVLHQFQASAASKGLGQVSQFKGRDQVVHRVSVSVSCQASRLSFTRRPPRAALSVRRYALIIAQPLRKAVPQNSKISVTQSWRLCGRVCGYGNIFNMHSPGARADSPSAMQLQKCEVCSGATQMAFNGLIWPVVLEEMSCKWTEQGKCYSYDPGFF